MKKETLAQVFSCEFCKISKNTFFTEYLWTTASRTSLWKILIAFLKQKMVAWEIFRTKCFCCFGAGEYRVMRKLGNYKMILCLATAQAHLFLTHQVRPFCDQISVWSFFASFVNFYSKNFWQFSTWFSCICQYKF